MSTPFVTLCPPVDVTAAGPDRLEAYDRAGHLLGTATHARDEHGDWFAWLVVAGAHRQVVATVTTAGVLLAQLAASMLDGAR